MGKNGDVNNKPVLMFIIAIFLIGAGFIFFFIPEFGATDEAGNPAPDWLRWLCILFWVCGALIFGAAIYKTIRIVKYKKLLNDSTAYITVGRFISAKMTGGDMTSFGGLPVSANIYKTLKYSYVDEHGVPHIVKSVYSFTPNQIAFLQNKSEFQIKCRGGVSAIIEPIPDANKLFNI